MLPQRPAGAPPPRPLGRPPGSPPVSPPGRPPGPPPGPRPGAPGSGRPAKPPPRGEPPPTTTLPNASPPQSPQPLPSSPQSPPRSLPQKAEAKAPDSATAAPSKKAPPPPRVDSPPASPAPTDDTPSASAADSRRSPKAPTGQPLQGPVRARPPEGLVLASTSYPSASVPARPPGCPPGRPPGSPPGPPPGPRPALPRDIPPRGTPTRTNVVAPDTLAGTPEKLLGRSSEQPATSSRSPLQEGSDNVIMTSHVAPGDQGLPIAVRGTASAIVDSTQAPSATLTSGEREETLADDRGSVVRRPRSTLQSTSGANIALVTSEELHPRIRGTQDKGVRHVDVDTADDNGSTHSGPPATKHLRSPPPSPKAPPGVPAGMIPPNSPPPSRPFNVAIPDKGVATAAEGEVSPARVPAALNTKSSPPGDPGKRRPPPGAPPGRKPPPTLPPSSRPNAPPAEDLALLKAKEEEITRAQSKDQQMGEDLQVEETHPPPPEGLPPPASLSDDDEDDSQEDGKSGESAEDETVAQHDVVEREPKDLEVVRPGRFTVRCISGGDVRRSTLANKTATVDVYLRVTLGKQKRAPVQKSKVIKRSGVSPDFGSESLAFDVVEPSDFIVGGDVTLSIELWDDNAWSDDLLASVELSALRFMHPDASPNVEWFPLEAPSGRIKDRMKVQVEITFEPALVGMFVLTLSEGRGLGVHDPAVTPNPYVVAALGDMYQKRSRVAKGGGSTPFFREEDIVLWIDRENWTHDLRIQVRSEDLGTDADLGVAKLSVLKAMAVPADETKERRLELMLEEEPAGQLFVKCAFLPAGKLTIVCKAGRGLLSASAAGRMDPYVVFKADGQAVSLSRTTKVDKDGGPDPRWEETLEMDIVDQYSLWAECFNHDLLESDELVGSAQCSILPAFKRGTMDLWIQLATSSGPGPPKPAGEIHCLFTFVGPLGVAYPQHQPGVDSFDDSLRVNLKGYLEEVPDGNEERPQPGEAAGAMVSFQLREPLQRSTEFTDNEIASAFKFLDLDHNFHLGAAEIRHILICMGELITDEEVDMMISMVDADGDGQVSYEEFHRLVIDPDPSRADFSTDPVASEANKQPAANTQDMKDKESKRWLLEDFVQENDIRAVELEMAYKRFRNTASAPGSEGGQGQHTPAVEMDFNTWMLVFNVEATGQYRKLFKLYATNLGVESGPEKVDAREFFLGMANFVDWPLEQRTHFIFTLFDEDRSGFLSQDELVQVLKANHITSAKAVAKKAQMIMRQADADGSGSLTLDEFLVVAKKFPNLLFPSKKPGGDKANSASVPLLANG